MDLEIMPLIRAETPSDSEQLIAGDYWPLSIPKQDCLLLRKTFLGLHPLL